MLKRYYKNIFINFSVSYVGRSSLVLLENLYDRQLLDFDKIICSDLNENQSKLSELIAKDDLSTEIFNKIDFINRSFDLNLVLDFIKDDCLVIPSSNTDINIVQNYILYKESPLILFPIIDDTSYRLWNKMMLPYTLKYTGLSKYAIHQVNLIEGIEAHIRDVINCRGTVSKLDISSSSRGQFVVDDKPRVFQELFPIDREFDLDFICDSEKIKFYLREELAFSNGYASLIRVITQTYVDPYNEMIRVARILIDYIKYTGVGSITFVMSKDGVIKILEFNARITGSASVYLEAVGANILAMDSIEVSDKNPIVYNNNRSYRIVE